MCVPRCWRACVQVLTELGADSGTVRKWSLCRLIRPVTPSRISKDYVAHFHPAIIGATGSEADIAAVAKQYGVVYMKEDAGSAAGYGFAHSDYIYLLDTQGRVRKLYDNQTRTTDISRDVRTLLAADRLF
jgi:hypothetical protein